MKLDEIFSNWGEDTILNHQDLSGEGLKIPKLHHKYFKILTNERMVLKKYETEMAQLKLEKMEFFLLGPTEETHAKGWKLPPRGKVLKADLGLYMDADQDIINLNLKIGIQNEKIKLLEDIIKTINTRNFVIKNIIEWEKFTSGSS